MKYLPNYNLWWPDFEHEPELGMVRIVKCMTDCDVVLPFVRTKGVALQAGGHIGLWARQLARHFAFVYTFEPVPDMYECLHLNVQGYPNIIPRQSALGATDGVINVEPRNGGRSTVSSSDLSIPVKMEAVDSMKLIRCDLMYLDVERYELEILKGAAETIEKFRPVIVMEVLGKQQEAVREWADKNKYSLVKQTHSDWIFTP